MLELKLSQIKALPFDFEAAVAGYVAALEHHRYTENEPAPVVPHPLVEAAVTRKQYPVFTEKPDDFVKNYTVIDDTPSLEERKEILAHEAARLAGEAMKIITPPLKQNMWHYQFADIMRVIEEDRTPEQVAFLAEHDARELRKVAVHRHLAKLHSDIHDLTAETIDAWQPAPFPT